jgi:uncharacterized membrane protein YozB (DUF420 family)
MNTVVLKPAPSTIWASGWRSLAVLGLAMILAVVFVAMFALRYFTWDQQVFGQYWPRRGWLLLHVTGGIVTLLLGPGQVWLGLKGERMNLHRRIGIAYMACVGLSSAAAFYLAAHTDLGWVFGAGLSGLAVAWLVTTGVGFAAIRRGQILQHQEWMIRSYVVTFAFVTFRIFAGITQAAGVGTIQEDLAAASWFCWAVPLLVTEAVLQGRKIFAA